MNRQLRFAATRKWAKARIYSAVASCHMHKHRANQRVAQLVKQKMKPCVIVHKTEWENMPKKTRKAFAEMCRAAIKQFSTKKKAATVK